MQTDSNLGTCFARASHQSPTVIGYRMIAAKVLDLENYLAVPAALAKIRAHVNSRLSERNIVLNFLS